MEQKDKKTYQFSNENGEAVLEIYTVFPGIQVVYSSVHMDEFTIGKEQVGDFIVINHCREGRIEQHTGEAIYYLTHGDLSIARKKAKSQVYTFPSKHYHGITIAMDLSCVPKCFSEFLEDVNVEPLKIAQQYCKTADFCILRKEEHMEHIFSEVYNIPEKIKIGFLKVKILELLLILSKFQLEKKKEIPSKVTKGQVEFAKQIADYLISHMEEHITIVDLTRKFHVSDTHLKKIFKMVYGVPVYSYIRIQKMHFAAQRLKYTEKSVLEIAMEMGYSNSSKFTAAFKDVMGETPKKYRMRHKNT